METVIQIIGFLGINFFIWWVLERWRSTSYARDARYAWNYLSWAEDELLDQHKQYVGMLARNENRALCIQQINAIKAALEMRQKLKAEGQRDGQR